MFELREGLFDGVQIRTVGRQEQKMRPGRADRPAHRCALVAAEIVHHHHITGREGRDQYALDISAEDVAVYRAVEDPRRVDPVMAKRRDEG